MRVAGTPEARRAWFVLRGPFLLAYFGITAYAASDYATNPSEVLWQGVVFGIGLMLMAGSIASGLIVARLDRGSLCPKVEVMEVIGLKAFWVFEYIYALWTLISPEHDNDATFAHFVIGSLALGVLLNMTWRKGAPHGR